MYIPAIENLDYARVYKAYSKQLAIDPFGFWARFYINTWIDPFFDAEVKELFHAKYPRRKVFKLELLDETDIAPIRDRWQKLALKIITHKEQQRTILTNILYQMAPQADMTPRAELQMVRSSSSHTYSSQGFGANRYAEGALKSTKILLDQHGFYSEIRCDDGQYIKSVDGYGYTYHNYELWTNAAGWQLDALERQQSRMDWATSCWNSGINPMVLNPFLDYDTFDRSMERHMGKEKT